MNWQSSPLYKVLLYFESNGTLRKSNISLKVLLRSLKGSLKLNLVKLIHCKCFLSVVISCIFFSVLSISLVTLGFFSLVGFYSLLFFLLTLTYQIVVAPTIINFGIFSQGYFLIWWATFINLEVFIWGLPLFDVLDTKFITFCHIFCLFSSIIAWIFLTLSQNFSFLKK